jgi:transposase
MELVRKIHEERKKMLRRIYRQSSRYQVRQRAHCLLLYQEGYSITYLEDIFQVSRKTIYNWLKAWELRGLIGLYNQKGQGRKPTFSPEQQDKIKEWTEENRQQLKQVSHKIKEQWDISVSTKTIKRVLKSLKMSWHRLRRVVGGQPNATEYAAKKAYLEELKRLDDAAEIDLYYSDQSGFCLIPPVPYGWQPVGETVGIPSKHSRRLNVFGVMNRHNQLHSYVSTQTITSDVIMACIDSFFPSVTKRTVIVMDKAPIHTSDIMLDQCLEWKQRQIEIFYLPSYSPQLNLIEILWRFIKYEWLPLSAYKCWQSLVDFVEKVLREFGENYVINFV